MRAGLATSVVLHATALALGLFTLSSPRSMAVADVEALPVDIVPIEAMTQIQQGDKKAPAKEKPAPQPTARPDTVPDAQNVGDADIDVKSPPKPESKPKPVETAAAPPPAPEPKPLPKPVEDKKPDDAKPVPVPATEVTPEPQPKQEVKPDPAPEPKPAEKAEPTPEPKAEPDQVAEAIAAEKPKPDTMALPDNAPAPIARPKPPEAQTAKTPDRKDAEQPKTAAASKPKSTEKDFDEDKIAALLNKDKASGGGAKRSTQQASLGGEKSTGGDKLSQSEMDALRGQVQKCWSLPGGGGGEDMGGMKVSVHFKLDAAGQLQGSPEVISGGDGGTLQRAVAGSAVRAIIRCQPYNLPADKYDTWSEVVVNFDPSDMF